MAVSGLHCCFLASLIGSLMGDRRKKLRCAVTIPLIFLYAFVTGLTPSILRACIMISMGMIAPLLGRDNDPPTSISFALLLILLKIRSPSRASAYNYRFPRCRALSG